MPRSQGNQRVNVDTHRNGGTTMASTITEVTSVTKELGVSGGPKLHRCGGPKLHTRRLRGCEARGVEARSLSDFVAGEASVAEALS